jgi:hypothetical protein
MRLGLLYLLVAKRTAAMKESWRAFRNELHGNAAQSDEPSYSSDYL